MVFISHAGPDKKWIALPLRRALEEMGIKCFVDETALRPGDESRKKMDLEIQRCAIGVFILLPEFFSRKWPLKELRCFQKRSETATDMSGPKWIPAFYRMTVEECDNRDFYEPNTETGLIAFREGFHSKRMRKEISMEEALDCVRKVTDHAGIRNDEGAQNVEGKEDERRLFVESLANAVAEAWEEKKRNGQEMPEV